jgi:hypothetical protein
MFTISVAARLISAGLPAPSMTTRSWAARSRARLSATVPSPVERRAGAAEDDDLRAVVALGLEQDRVHVHGRRDARRLGLRGLRPPDLAAVGRDRGVQRHVLGLEGRHAVARAREEPAERGREDALADPRARPLHHEAPGRG